MVEQAHLLTEGEGVNAGFGIEVIDDVDLDPAGKAGLFPDFGVAVEVGLRDYL